MMKRLMHYSITGIIVLALLLSGTLSAVSPVEAAANPAPVQLYYVTLPEIDGLRVLSGIHSAAIPPMYTYFSISIPVDGTFIYYDQWENGYALDIANPTPAEIYSAGNIGGVQIWGNGRAADGCAPNINGVPFTCTDAADVLHAGDVIIPNNAIPLPPGPPIYNVLDRFNTVAYNNQDGNANWTSNWVESGDNGNPASGQILITGNQLRFAVTDANDGIDRGLDLSAAGECSTLTFTLGKSSTIGSNDRLQVRMSSGGSYNSLVSYDQNEPAGTKTVNIPATYRTANARLQFRSQDALESGDYWTIDDVQVSYGCAPERDRNAIYFDGCDKVGATHAIAMTRAVWASGSGTLNAFGHEMYATAEWGKYYESPVGTNTANAGQMFEYAGLSIMASQNGTTVNIDKDANGTFETTITLNEGGSYLVEGVSQGARVSADKPLQVVLVTGDIGSTYASRDMNLLPVEQWGNSYWSPVGAVYSTNNTRLFIYNLSSNGSTYITCEKYGAANVTSPSPVLPGGVWTTDLANGQGANCYTSLADGKKTDGKIQMIGTIDTTGTAYDWSFTAYPDNFLTTEGLVGLGLGRDPLSSTNQTENGNPIWVTTTCEGGTYVYVDWDNDGIADPIDTNGDGTAEPGSENGILLNRLQSLRLFEPVKDVEPYDQSGARVWSRTASGVGHGGTPGCLLALAWGQDPANATASAPGLDVGTSIPPLRLIEGTKALEVVTDTAPLGILNAGDIVYYNITVKNTGSTMVNNVYVWDDIPLHTAYVPGSTEYKLDAGGWAQIPDDLVGDGFPLDADGGVLLGDLAVGSTYYVRFKIEILPGDYEVITNCEQTFTSGGDLEVCVVNPVATRDWGDLPDSYGTTAATDGPRHSYSGLMLGVYWDLEAQGQPGLGLANGDDLNGFPDDEDGVAVVGNASTWEAGSGQFLVTVTGGPGCLDAWMDFTDDAGSGVGYDGLNNYVDGNFTKAGGGYDTYNGKSEHVIRNLLLTNATNIVNVDYPPMVFNEKSYYFRFRITPPVAGGCEPNILPTGYQAGGEVEDYLFTWGTPTAVDLMDFSASSEDGTVIVTWETASELDNLGFNILRSTSVAGVKVRLNNLMLPTNLPPGSMVGSVYEFTDLDNLERGKVYYYWLEDVDIYGIAHINDPVAVKVK